MIKEYWLDLLLDLHFSKPSIILPQACWVSSFPIYEIGCCCGALLTFVIGEPLGRRYSIILGLSIMLVGTALQASAFSVPHMLVGRVVTGIGNGINT